jgi:hypothetical protein
LITLPWNWSKKTGPRICIHPFTTWVLAKEESNERKEISERKEEKGRRRRRRKRKRKKKKKNKPKIKIKIKGKGGGKGGGQGDR